MIPNGIVTDFENANSTMTNSTTFNSFISKLSSIVVGVTNTSATSTVNQSIGIIVNQEIGLLSLVMIIAVVAVFLAILLPLFGEITKIHDFEKEQGANKKKPFQKIRF